MLPLDGVWRVCGGCACDGGPSGDGSSREVRSTAGPSYTVMRGREVERGSKFAHIVSDACYRQMVYGGSAAGALPTVCHRVMAHRGKCSPPRVRHTPTGGSRSSRGILSVGRRGKKNPYQRPKKYPWEGRRAKVEGSNGASFVVPSEANPGSALERCSVPRRWLMDDIAGEERAYEERKRV